MYIMGAELKTFERGPMALRRRTVPGPVSILALIFLSCAAAPVRAQTPLPSNFLAEHYDISATLDPIGQSISAVAKIDFKAIEASSTVRVELHPNLVVKEVKGPDGKPLTFERDNQNSLTLIAHLPGPIATDGHVTLTYTYAGLLVNEENSPIPGVRAAVINKEGAYLLLPARWFPLTNYPSNRYIATFHLNVPDVFAVAGTGKSSAPTPMAGKNAVEGNRLLYTFECKNLASHGTFVVGNLQLNPKQAEGINVNVYAPRAASENAQKFADDVARASIIFSDMFGPIPDPTFTVIQIPDGTLREYAAPGVLLLSQRIWDPRGSDRTIARLVASQWWGIQVTPATSGDAWISDGLARYCEALYAEQNAGKEAGLRTVDEFAVGALMYEDAAPIGQAARLIPYSPDYRSVVMNKGAMLFHMLRAQMGDVAFKAALHDFYFQFAEHSARVEDFEKIADRRAQAAVKPGQEPPNLRGFFAQWLNSTGVPEFTLEYVVYRTPKGFRVVGKIKQPLDTFRMPVDLRIETEGNPELKTIDVIGTESGFTVETFGRPKPGGIKIDPNNLILKGGTALRARAAIARGEDLAEQGRFYDAITQYQRALTIQPGRPLANFRMGEAFFYQKNYQAAANAFREATQTVPEPSEKWTEVWSHIYLGKIFDMLGQRERAVNEYSKAKQTNDDTGGAQKYAEGFLKKPYTEGGTSVAAPATNEPAAKPASASIPAPASGEKPVLKRPNPPQR
jgi:predicted negative regulator of RcsB-dependent stress response